MKVSVEQGRIHVNQVWIQYKSDSVLIIESDVRAKHCTVEGISYGSDGSVSFLLGKGPYTRKDEPTNVLTRITFSELGPGPWTSAYECDRYGVVFVLYKADTDGTIVWQDNDVTNEPDARR